MLRRVVSDVLRAIASSGRSPAGPLAGYFFDNPGRLIHKWHHYLEIYHRHLAPFRRRSPVVLEIGVSHGGSLQMWKRYFGPGARIVGIDVDPRCRQFEEDRVSVLIGDQADRAFLADVRQRVPHVDILIDDGGHTMQQQIAGFEELYPHIQPDGVYICEDMHSSLWPQFGGGYRRPGTFLEYSKNLVDRLYAWHSIGQDELAVDAFTRSTFALHFYDSMLVIEKRPIELPRESRIGRPSF
jgi:SAM-dependent methyltransferase